MTAQDVLNKWKEFVGSLNSKGIPLPMARDPQTGQGSVSLSMVIVSFGIMSICSLTAAALVVNKWTGFFDADASAVASLKEAFSMAFQMSALSASLYWGRKFQRDDKGNTSVEGDKK